MGIIFSKTNVRRRAWAMFTTGVLILVLSVWQTNILKVSADVQVLLVSDTAIPFGTVFPGEILTETYTVQLDTSEDEAEYQTTLSLVPGFEDLCPWLEVISIDEPAEGDTLPSSFLVRPGDELDRWQVKLMVPGLEGQVAQDHDGGVVVTAGDYACDINITTDLSPGEPGLEIEKSGEFDESNNHITYTIDWSVTGEGVVEGVTITDELPSGTIFVSATAPGVYSTTTDSVTWELGDITAPDSGSVEFVVDSFFDIFYDDVLDYQPGSSAAGAIRVLDATADSPVPPDLEGAIFPVIDVPDLGGNDALFVNTEFFGDFGDGPETKTVDDEAQTFVALGDGGQITIDTSTSTGAILKNGPGTDFILYETPNIGGKDPSCVSVMAVDGTVYPLVAEPACQGERAFKFQDQGDSLGIGLPINLDSLGVPDGEAVKSVTIYDLFDGHILGSTGSPGYDLDAVFGRGVACEILNTAEISATGFETVSDSFTIFFDNPECEEIIEDGLGGDGEGVLQVFGTLGGGGSGSGGDSNQSNSANTGSSSNSQSNNSGTVLGESVNGDQNLGDFAGVTELPRTGLPGMTIWILLILLASVWRLPQTAKASV